MLHPLGAVGGLEHQAEGGGADHDEHHEACQLGGRGQGLLEQVHVQATAGKTHDEGRHGAHGTAFGRCCNAQEDGAQHQEDQQQRGDQHKGHALGQLGQQAQLEDPVERGDHEGDEGAAAHGGDDLLVGGDFGDFLALPPGVQVGHVIGQEDGHDGRDAHDHGQRGIAGVAVGLAVDARFGRQCRHGMGLEDGEECHPDHVQAHEHEAGDEGALVHIAHALAQLVGHQNQHQRGRDDLGQRARGRNHARCEAAVIAVAQHDGQRDQAHGNHRSSNHAGGGSQQRAHKDHGQRQTAADGAEHLADCVKQVLCHA